MELRRRFTSRTIDVALIYTSKTEKAICARVEVKKVELLPINRLWQVARNTAAVSRQEFDDYLVDLEAAYAITLGRVEILHRPISMVELRRKFNIVPPQSFRFAPELLVDYSAERCGNT
jgi:predicted transcriptional regulator